ncbi:hypothetical protein HDV57DRAFT_492549 [Trichoderma longibrachiatum]
MSCAKSTNHRPAATKSGHSQHHVLDAAPAQLVTPQEALDIQPRPITRHNHVLR